MSYPVIDPVATGERINMLRKELGFSVAYLKEYLDLPQPMRFISGFMGSPCRPLTIWWR